MVDGLPILSHKVRKYQAQSSFGDNVQCHMQTEIDAKTQNVTQSTADDDGRYTDDGVAMHLYRFPIIPLRQRRSAPVTLITNVLDPNFGDLKQLSHGLTD